MNVFLLLDILLLILIALFIPIGFWRGTHRELFVTLGILFGAALGRFWAEPWGSDLAEFIRLRESGGVFMIAVLFLIGITFLLGYGAGTALTVPRPGWKSRMFGAIIAGLNGALLLGFALQDIRIYLLGDQAPGFLDRAVVAQFLMLGMGWLLLGAAAVFVPIVVVLALLSRGRTVATSVGSGGEIGSSGATGWQPSPRVSDDSPSESTAVYKTEPPERGYESESETTRRLEIQPMSAGELWGGSASRGSTEEHAVIAQREMHEDPQDTLRQRHAPESEGGAHAASSGEKKCPSCHSALGGSERFCSQCGGFL
jgi:uncharacterized membrane protein required for colicin V production